MKINLKRLATNKEFDKKKVSLSFNIGMNDKQLEAGILGKVTIHHPAFVTRATLYAGKKDGEIRVQPSSVKTGKDSWFNIVSLTRNLRDYIVEEFLKIEEEGTTPWYLNMQEQEAPQVLDDTANESLDIEDIVYSVTLTDKQKGAGIVAKATIRTSIGSLRGLTIFKSKFGQSLYAVAQAEDEDGDIPAYRLTKQAEAQVLLFLHNSMEEWDAPAETKEEKKLSAEEQREKIKNAVNSEPVAKVNGVFK